MFGVFFVCLFGLICPLQSPSWIRMRIFSNSAFSIDSLLASLSQISRLLKLRSISLSYMVHSHTIPLSTWYRQAFLKSALIYLSQDYSLPYGPENVPTIFLKHASSFAMSSSVFITFTFLLVCQMILYPLFKTMFCFYYQHFWHQTCEFSKPSKSPILRRHQLGVLQLNLILTFIIQS